MNGPSTAVQAQQAPRAVAAYHPASLSLAYSRAALVEAHPTRPHGGVVVSRDRLTYALTYRGRLAVCRGIMDSFDREWCSDPLQREWIDTFCTLPTVEDCLLASRRGFLPAW